jgi:hypothetical protein
MIRVWTRTAATAVLLAGMAVSSINSTMAADEQPDATFTFSGGSAAIGVGVTWGHGTLQYGGKEYSFRLHGVDLVDVGGGKLSGTGKVYNLNRVDDFAGNYAAATAGAALAAGGEEIAMHNHRGVSIRLRAETKGAQLQAAIEGLTIELEAPAK